MASCFAGWFILHVFFYFTPHVVAYFSCRMLSQVEKIYKDSDADPREKFEEMSRMREHVLREVQRWLLKLLLHLRLGFLFSFIAWLTLASAVHVESGHTHIPWIAYPKLLS